MEDKISSRSVEELSEQRKTNDPITIDAVDKCSHLKPDVVIETGADTPLQSDCLESSLQAECKRRKSPPHSWPSGNLRNPSTKWMKEQPRSYQKIVSLFPVLKTELDLKHRVFNDMIMVVNGGSRGTDALYFYRICFTN